ncbi:hypothetical protein JAAARDRAFT_332294 [Jaapia argillacea MUCL 33604]|uniref:Smr domain-containing protein n=1 Tax=Jaapia argillacea MUCL 33604 TaxID=933084 RepID=A0A067PQ04_9AGAM|nr:hypothetical protein JAAARDRAFT_332294 [Jaapia argillacea MUCL 33604]
MESLFAIGLGLGLRALIDLATHHNARLGGTLVGIWEGIVLHHFTNKMPLSCDPYIAMGTRMFVDLVITESWQKLGVTLLWTGMGFLLSDLWPAIWYDLGLRSGYRQWRRLRRQILGRMSLRGLDLSFAVRKPRLPSRVRFYTVSTTASDITPETRTLSTPQIIVTPVTPPRRTSHPVPGSFTDTASDGSSIVNVTIQQRTEPPEPVRNSTPTSASRNETMEPETPALRIMTASMMTPPDYQDDDDDDLYLNDEEFGEEHDRDLTPTPRTVFLPQSEPVASPVSIYDYPPQPIDEHPPPNLPWNPAENTRPLHPTHERPPLAMPWRFLNESDPTASSAPHFEPPPNMPWNFLPPSDVPLPISPPHTESRSSTIIPPIEIPPVAITPTSAPRFNRPRVVPPPIVPPPISWDMDSLPRLTPGIIPSISDIPEIEAEEQQLQNQPPITPIYEHEPEPDYEYVYGEVPDMGDMQDISAPDEGERRISTVAVRRPSDVGRTDALPSPPEEGADDGGMGTYVHVQAPSSKGLDLGDLDEERETTRTPPPSFEEATKNLNVPSAHQLSRTPSSDRHRPLPPLPSQENLHPPSIQQTLNTSRSPSPNPSFHQPPSPTVHEPPSPAYERPSTPPRLQTQPQSPSSPQTPHSIISPGTRDSIIQRADLLRSQADAADRERSRLEAERTEALKEHRPLRALSLKLDAQKERERSMKLHERAARRYFHAHNLSSAPRTIDVHRLKVPEAIRVTEKAIRDQLLNDGVELRVIVGKGLHSAGKIPALKLALIRELQSQKIPVKVDQFNAGVLVISLPSS